MRNVFWIFGLAALLQVKGCHLWTAQAAPATAAANTPLPPVPFDGITIAAAPAPTNYTQNVTLAWDRHTDPTVTGYKLYWGTGPRFYTNNLATTNITATVSNLAGGRTFYFSATAFSATGLESDYSNEVSYTVPSPPSPPTNLRITLTVQGASSGGGPFIGLGLPPVILTNSLAVGQQYYRLQIGSELIP